MAVEIEMTAPLLRRHKPHLFRALGLWHYALPTEPATVQRFDVAAADGSIPVPQVECLCAFCSHARLFSRSRFSSPLR